MAFKKTIRRIYASQLVQVQVAKSEKHATWRFPLAKNPPPTSWGGD